MDKFSVKCPDHYPMKCHLSPADKDHLLSAEKYKGFFISQYNDQDDWLLPTIERFFNERTWRLFNAGSEGGTGTNFCNVCRYALASDFGIVSLTPLNYNVFQEIGLMQGLQKPLLYILNPKRNDELPFDIADQIYIEHNDSKSLEEGLNKKIPLFIVKVELYSAFEREQRQMIKSKISGLNQEAIKILECLVLEGNLEFPQESQSSMEEWIQKRHNIDDQQAIVNVRNLRDRGFIIRVRTSANAGPFYSLKLNESYRKYLEEFLW